MVQACCTTTCIPLYKWEGRYDFIIIPSILITCVVAYGIMLVCLITLFVLSKTGIVSKEKYKSWKDDILEQ